MSAAGAEAVAGGALWAAKICGAIAGSAISLAYFLPRGKREAAIRFLSGVAGGVVFGATVGTVVAKELGITTVLNPFETVLMGAALASLTLWWALGFALRFIGHKTMPPADEPTKENNDGR